MPDVKENDLIEQGALPPDDFHDNIERIREVAQFNLEVPSDLKQRLMYECQHLLVDEGTLFEAAAALEVGHLVLQGPPGTGKSSLARALCRAFQAVVLPVTAHEDWSTFEVIGRQELRVEEDDREQIVPVNGFFTESVIRCAGAIVRHFDDPNEPQAAWLLIDELNRAHLDKAFGELFTVLGTDELVPITLPHQREGNRELVTPRRFRIVATLNSIDRQFVNSLSQGLKRRFTFITLEVPAPMESGEHWGSRDSGASLASREFTVVIERAADRVARRLVPANADGVDAKRAELTSLLQGAAFQTVVSLFELVKKLRYAQEGSSVPYLAIGTAQLIDTVELFLSRVCSQDLPEEKYGATMDWAASVKLAPLFDADTISPADLERYVTNALQPPFDMLMRRELRRILSSGMYYVG